MASRLSVDLIETIKPVAEECLHDAARRLARLRYADLRLEVSEAKWAAAENGSPKGSGDDESLSLGVRVLAGDRTVAPGYAGLALGAADAPDLPRILRDALERAYRRATANAEQKAEAREKFGGLGEALGETRLHPVEIRRDTVPAAYRVDPRALDLGEMTRFATDVSRQVACVDPALK